VTDQKLIRGGEKTAETFLNISAEGRRLRRLLKISAERRRLRRVFEDIRGGEETAETF
jgi:hypothetical protein